MTEYSSKKFMGGASVAIGEIKEFFGDYPPLLEIDNMTFIKDGHVATAGFDESLNEYANNGINWVSPELKTGFRSSTGLFHGFSDSQQPVVYAGNGVWFGVLNRVYSSYQGEAADRTDTSIGVFNSRIVRTKDNGITWEVLKESTNPISSSARLYFITSDGAGSVYINFVQNESAGVSEIYTSLDFGETWKENRSGGGIAPILARGNQSLYARAGRLNGVSATLVRSVSISYDLDGNIVYTPTVIRFLNGDYSPTNQNLTNVLGRRTFFTNQTGVWIALAESVSGTWLRSTDNGQTWASFSPFPAIGGYNSEGTLFAEGALWIGTVTWGATLYIVRSLDGGVTWERLAPIPAGYKIIGLSKGVCYIDNITSSSTGEIRISKDQGASFQFLTDLRLPPVSNGASQRVTTVGDGVVISTAHHKNATVLKGFNQHDHQILRVGFQGLALNTGDRNKYMRIK